MEPMALQRELEENLHSLPSLTRGLSRDNAGMALLRADGTWHLETAGTVRLQSTPLPTKTSAQLVELVSQQGPQCVLDHWWVRSLAAGHPSTVIFERRPGASIARLSRHTVELLRARIQPNANGLIFGESQEARAGILLSLTRFLPADLIVYVGPVPPLPPDGVSLVHVPPPRHDRDRRQMATLFERASAVLFDGSIRRSDIRILFSNANVTNRWLAVEAANPDEWMSSFVLPPALKAPITTRIGVRASPTRPIRLDHLSVRRDSGWDILLDQDDFDDGSASQEETTTEGGPVRLSAQITSPIDHRSTSADVSDPSHRKRPPTHEAPPAPTSQDEQEFNVRSLLDDDGDGDAATSPADESGIIDVFVAGAASESDDDTAERRLELSAGLLRGQRIDDELPSLIAAGNIDDIEIPRLDPEQLRQTYSKEVDSDSLQQERQRHRKNQQDDADGADDAAPAGDKDEEEPSEEIFVDDTPDTRPIEAEPDDLELDDDPPAQNQSMKEPSDRHDGDGTDGSDDRSASTSSARSRRSRKFRRTSQLAAESSATCTPRKTPSKRRVLPVPSSDPKRTEATTTELGAFDSEEVRNLPRDSDAESD